MATTIKHADVEIGASCRRRASRDARTASSSARASGDFSPIHWNEKFAVEVGLPDVIAHGMFTMAEAIRVVTDWAGDPAAVVEYGVRSSAGRRPERRQGRRDRGRAPRSRPSSTTTACGST